MVTPAFLEARRRKEKNEITNGRVLPPTSADVLRSTSNKYLVAATSLPPSRMRSIDFKEAKFKADHDAKSNMEENKHSPGKVDKFFLCFITLTFDVFSARKSPTLQVT